MLWEGKDGRAETYTFAQMAAASNKAANALRGLGVQKGDRVFFFLERVPELYFAAFGALKLGAVIGPLFSAFGPDAVRDRLADSGAQVHLTSPSCGRRVERYARLPELRHVVTSTATALPCGHRRPGRGFDGSRTRSRSSARTRGLRGHALQLAPPVSRRAPPTFTPPSSATTPPRSTSWTCTTRTSTGAPPIPAG
jgi:acyl-CoA synthetase (AMP-forming)/AMP-acid ligase II